MSILKFILFTTIFVVLLACDREREFHLVEPEFTVSEDTLIVQNNNLPKGFFIRVNAGYLTYTLKGLPNWIAANSIQGQANSEGKYIDLYFPTSELPLSPQSFELFIETAIGSKKIFVLFIPNTKQLFVQSEISLNTNKISNLLPIFNPHLKETRWNAVIDNDLISLNKLNGNLSIGGNEILSFTINKEKISAFGVYMSNITFTADNNTYKTKVIILNNPPTLKLDRNVIDALYSRQLKEIIFISSEPKTINRLNPENNQMKSLNLNFSPLSISISADGKKAVIGCDAKILHVDIENMIILNTFVIDGKIVNISYAPNDFAYALDDKWGWVNLKEVNLKTGAFSVNQQIIYTGSVGRLHPNGKWLYVADNSVSPADVRKFSLSNNGASTYLYDSPYHGDYIIGGGVWFTEKGEKMLTGEVFLSCSESESQDLRYAGSINLPVINQYKSRIWTAEYSTKNNIFYVSLNYSFHEQKFSDGIYAYNSDSHELVATYTIDPFLDQNNNSVPAQPRFLFKSDKTLYILAKSQKEEIWVIQKIVI